MIDKTKRFSFDSIKAVIFAACPETQLKYLNSGRPHGLLKVNSEPIIYNSVRSLISAKFKFIVVACYEKDASQISKSLHSEFPATKFEFATFPEDENSTVKILLALNLRFPSFQLLLVPSDFFGSPNIHEFVLQHSIHSPLLSLLRAPAQDYKKIQIPATNTFKKNDSEVFCFDSGDPTNLLMTCPLSQVIEDKTTIRKDFLSRISCFVTSLSYIDPQIYIFSLPVLDLIRKKFANSLCIKSDLVPQVLEILSTEKLSSGSYLENRFYLHPTDSVCFRVSQMQDFIFASRLYGRALGQNCSIGEDCSLTNSVVSDRCVVGDGTVLKDCVVGVRARIGKDCVVENSVIGDDVVVGDSSTINCSVVLPLYTVGTGVQKYNQLLGEIFDDSFNLQIMPFI